MAASTHAPADPAPWPIKADHEHTSSTMNKMLNLQNQGILTDFEIRDSRQGTQVIHCHKLVLWATCPYFESMLASTMKESVVGVAIIENIDFPILQALVKYLYTEELSVAWKDVTKMIAAADMLLLPGVKEQLGEYVMENISVRNCIGWFKRADQFHMEKVARKAQLLMRTQFEEVASSQEFKCLTFNIMVDLCNRENFPFENRDIYLYLCMQWVQDNPIIRVGYISDLLKQVKLESCTANCLQTLSTKYKPLITDPEVKAMIYEAVLPMMSQVVPRKPPQKGKKLVILGGMRAYNEAVNRKCWALDTLNLREAAQNGVKWHEFVEIPLGFQRPQSPICMTPDGFAVLCGGESGKEGKMYYIRSDVWTDLPTAPFERNTYQMAVYHDNAIFVVSQGDPFYKLDLVHFKWERMKDLSGRDCWNRICVYDSESFFIFKGKELLQYWPKTGKIKRAAECSDKHNAGLNLVPIKREKNLYVLGGHDKRCLVYDVYDNRWKKLARPPTDQAFGSALELDGRIYMFGGDDAGSNLILEYDINSNSWAEIQLKLPKALQFHTAAVFDF